MNYNKEFDNVIRNLTARELNDILSEINNKYFTTEEEEEEEEIKIYELNCILTINEENGEFDLDIYDDSVYDTKSNYKDEYKNEIDEDFEEDDYYSVTTWYINKKSKQKKLQLLKERLYNKAIQHQEKALISYNKNKEFINITFKEFLRTKKLDQINGK